VAHSANSITSAKLPATSAARNIAALLPVIALPAAAFLGYSLPPWQFMWLLAFAIFFALKWATWLRAHGETRSWTRSFAYLFLWPGMDAESFLAPAVRVAPPTAKQWLATLAQTLTGAALLWLVVRRLPDIPLLCGWTGMLGAGLLLHFGSFRLVALFWRWRGIDARPIMDAPLRSTSLAEFWGRRWNLGFRDLAHTLLFSPAQRALGAAMATVLVFIFSGLIHDLVISVPARGGYGLPTLYFLIQASALLFERSRRGRRLGLACGTRGWLFTLVFVAAPACILFHPPFISRVFLPFMRAIGAL
jgi:alginate O-acetyltransferase complex protein AlgI